jgi:DNA-binding NarL/FixJ family response regulator
MSIRLMICDDHEVIRTGLATLLAGTDIQIVAESTNAKDAVKVAQKDKPDIIMLDVLMSDGDGLATLEKLRQKAPESKVIMFSMHNNPTYIARATALGASDYLLKGATRADIIATIKACAAGESPSPTGELGKIAATMKLKQAINDEDVPLTPRETQVLRHVALGLSNKDIGNSLQISVETVKEHVQNIFRKLALNDRTKVAVWAIRKGLV